MDDDYRIEESEIEEFQFDIFNSDINLLSVQLLLSAWKLGKDTLTLEYFIKGDYWKVDELSSELQDTGDFVSTQDWVLAQVISTIENLRLGEIENITITSIHRLIEAIIEDAMDAQLNDYEKEEMIGYYRSLIDEAYKLNELSKEQLEQFMEKNPGIDKWRGMLDQVALTKDNYGRYLSALVAVGASHIDIKINFSAKWMLRMEEAMRDYLKLFANDLIVNNTPNYRETRYYYSKQLENFVAYINKLPEIEGVVNIPFDVLSEKGFEFVKIISFLEQKQKVYITQWDNNHMWNIRFWETPITIHSLTSAKKEETVAKPEKLETDLSFSEERGELSIEGKTASFRKDTDPYQVLKIIFSDPTEVGKEWFYSEIGELFDPLASFPDKKFANAIYRANQKIAIDTGIRDFFISTKQVVSINQKYLK
jgi:hypothetical protein